MNYPVEFKYTKDHEWCKIDGNKAQVGITHHAQSALGDIVFADLPKVGRTLKKSESFGVVESIKAVSDLYSPLTGQVTRVNSDVIAEPSLLNNEPHGAAWLIEMEITDMTSISDLLSAEAYESFVKSLA